MKHKSIIKFFLLILTVLSSSNLIGQTYNASLVDLVGVSTTSNSVIKTAGNGWGNAGCASENELAESTSGWAKTTITETSSTRFFGLSSSNTNAHWNTIGYGIYFRNTGEYRVYENGSKKWQSGGNIYSINDEFEIDRTGSVVSYKRNGVVFYTSNTASSSVLIVDISMYHNNSEVSNIVTSFNVPGADPTCDDNIQNGDETGVDCGGSCDPCPTCDDNIQNGDETGIDCGGSDCDACPTCDDNIQNGDETGVDCGGSDCDACPTCDDNIQNGDETGVDCGGSCPNACGGGGGSTVWTESGNDIRYSDGKVFIGNEALDVSSNDYNLFVEKGIMTERLKVAIEGSGDWADYVFADDYKRVQLGELEAYIKTNKHLPNVPSADEVAKNGIDVAKMDATLLQQIEELWLHVIDLKKENISLKKEINEIKNK